MVQVVAGREGVGYTAGMIELTPDECRVLGVLVEKAQTTPDQYPLTLNAVMSGANQKNNREPLMMMDDRAALAAVNGCGRRGC